MNLFALVLAVVGALDAGIETSDVEALDALDEQLLTAPVVVASASGIAQKNSESPGVVSVITREEIENLGARDLIDVLRFVPGFNFTNDVENTVGLSIRGISALEGKVLFMLDGQPLNDLSYGNMLFGSREAISLIERIEVIRGPGSAIYGGFAELGVINVITRSDAKDEVRGSLSTGFWSNVARVTGALAANKTFGDVTLRASVFSGSAIRSDQSYLQGSVFNLRDYSKIRPLSVSASLEWKGLKVQFLYDDFAADSEAREDPSAPFTVHNKNLMASARYDLVLSSAVTLSAFASYLRQNPWQADDGLVLTEAASGYYFDKPIDRIRGGLSGQFTPLQTSNHTVRVQAGALFTSDSSTVDADTPAVAIYNVYYDRDGANTNHLAFVSFAAFAEATWLNPIVNVTAGARYDWQSSYGGAFVPRVALTKELGGFHAKALLGRAFRGPTFENISLLPTIKPETTTVIELEAGYQWRNWLYVGVNAYDNRVYDAIVYQQTDVSSSYLNAGQTGTRGVEAQVRARGSWGYANLAYAFYTVSGDTVAQYAVDGHPTLHLGIPAHSLTLHASFKVTSHLSINPAVVVYSERYGLESTLADPDTAVLTRFPPSVLGSLFLVYRNLGFDGLDVAVGVHDLFGANYRFVSAYNSGVNALPQMGREVLATLTFRHDLVK